MFGKRQRLVIVLFPSAGSDPALSIGLAADRFRSYFQFKKYNTSLNLFSKPKLKHFLTIGACTSLAGCDDRVIEGWFSV